MTMNREFPSGADFRKHLDRWIADGLIDAAGDRQISSHLTGKERFRPV
jgi:hypothetical protein